MSSLLTQEMTSGCKNMKRQTFTRSASLDRIVQLNLYICTQHIFLLPALFSWLKSSHTVLQSHVDKYIRLLKGLSIAGTYRILALLHLKTLKEETISAYRCTRLLYHRHLSNVFTIVVAYLAVTLIFAQLLTCLYLIFNTTFSIGVFFLFVCIHLISLLNFVAAMHYSKTESKKRRDICLKR